jgi:hypothetical protein
VAEDDALTLAMAAIGSIFTSVSFPIAPDPSSINSISSVGDEDDEGAIDAEGGEEAVTVGVDEGTSLGAEEGTLDIDGLAEPVIVGFDEGTELGLSVGAVEFDEGVALGFTVRPREGSAESPSLSFFFPPCKEREAPRRTWVETPRGPC